MDEREVKTYTCEIVEENLSDLLEGHVTPALKDGLIHHLAVCGECQALKEAVAETVIECRSLSGAIEVNADFESSLITAVMPDWKTDCATFEENLSLFIDGSTDRNLDRRMSSHLSECSNCAGLHAMVSQSVAELRANRDADSISSMLNKRLSMIPSAERPTGFVELLRTRLREVTEILEPLFSSPLVGQSTVAAILLMTSIVFFGVRTEAQENERPAISKGYEMVVKTYRDGTDVVMNAVSYQDRESNGGRER
jgi:hypothetical protein